MCNIQQELCILWRSGIIHSRREASGSGNLAEKIAASPNTATRLLPNFNNAPCNIFIPDMPGVNFENC
jgi:hypothetical protein